MNDDIKDEVLKLRFQLGFARALIKEGVRREDELEQQVRDRDGFRDQLTQTNHALHRRVIELLEIGRTQEARIRELEKANAKLIAIMGA